MNSSRKTKIVAQGIARFAAVQDLRGDDKSEEAEAIRLEWSVWCDAYPQWMGFVEIMQRELFDRINGQVGEGGT